MDFAYDNQAKQNGLHPKNHSFLLWNGLGGYCGMCADFSVNRADSGVLVAAVKAPNQRITLVHRLTEQLHMGAETVLLSGQGFADAAPAEDGALHLDGYCTEGVPLWHYTVGDISVQRSCAMAYGENTTALVYTLCNSSDTPCTFTVTPYLKFAPKETALTEKKSFTLHNNRITADGYSLYVHTGGVISPCCHWQMLSYPADKADGRPDRGFAGSCCRISAPIPAKAEVCLEIVFSTESRVSSAADILQAEQQRLQQLRNACPLSHPEAKQLAVSADSYIVRRDSTGGKTILAGYPLFSDWGRDTMIALPGCCLSTGRYADAKSILQTFLTYERDGLVPNLFPEGDQAPMYNTVDAALLLIDALWQYYQRTKDLAFLQTAWPVMERIIAAYRQGTRHNIGMDSDGLIHAGEGLDQVTWMDVRIENILPTPRHGKPVEINAYWYNALKIMEVLSSVLQTDGKDYAALAKKVRQSFCEKFYLPDKGYLRDVISGTAADRQIRCNQVWALAMSFTMLPPEWEHRVLEVVKTHLLTDCGLRTLSPRDPQYQGFYGGSQFQRDMAYHQGTTWVFPLGAYCRACLRIYGKDGIPAVKQQLANISAMLEEGCTGQLPEIYDGDNPKQGKGCYAQAWSVGEILRVYEMLEKNGKGSKNMKLDKTQPGWWKDAVFYQIYPKSFQDTTGTGVGDLQGIISRLDYLEKLGIDGIWLSPICRSPQVDNGYDISDYCSVDPMFGTMEDMQQLIDEAKKRGISIIMDLVLNHCSNQHPWFLEALKGKDNPCYNYFIWRDGTPEQFPNDMRSVFGGPAWTYVPELGQYYFHQFTPQQPDLNWEEPALRQKLYDSIRFWVNKGVEGFRLDVIDQIAKEPDNHITINGPQLHKFFRELSAEAFREKWLVSVGETWGADVERAKLYSASDCSELSMVFQFQHMSLDQKGEKWDATPLPLVQLKECYRHWQQGLHEDGWNSLFMNNHDLPRIVSRWGDDRKYRVASAKMLATMLHGMQGTPYIYQGEELGMTNIRLSIEQYRDVEIHNFYNERIAKGYSRQAVMDAIYARGRDNARTPMQWSGEKNAGFTTGQPWLPVNENFVQINAEKALNDPDSIFYYYQKLIQLRKQHSVFRDGDFQLLCPQDPDIFAYTRETDAEKLLIVCNFTPQCQAFALPAEFAQAEVLLSNYEKPGSDLPPYGAYILYQKKRKCDK